MIHPLSFLKGAGLGAGIMYFFDPDRGRRRRSLVRDQFIHACAVCERSADVLRRDAGNRLHGMVAEVQSLARSGQPSDDVLVQRVRARIGRAVSHPHAIHVDAHDGCVVLSGPVLSHEVENLIDNVRWVRGVQRVENQLDLHEDAGNFSALQGGYERYYQPLDIMQQNWSPTTRAAVGVAAAGLMANCMISRSPSAIILGTLGFTMAMQAARRTRGAGANMFAPWQEMQTEGRQSGRQEGRRKSPNADQGAVSPQRAASSPNGGATGGEEMAETGTNRSVENRRSSAGQADVPAIHDL
jgi:hypothetical protein